MGIFNSFRRASSHTISTPASTKPKSEKQQQNEADQEADIRNVEGPQKYLKALRLGYCNPIPTAWANNPSSPLCLQTPFSQYEDAAEERLYWVLNNHVHPHVPKQAFMRPNEWSEMRMANARMRRAQPIDPRYGSPYDTFRAQFGRRGYSVQVPPAPMHQEFLELGRTRKGGIGVDAMIMIDVSGSMGFEHYQSGFEQPRHIDVVHSILGRAMHHTTPRDHYHAPDEEGGIRTVLFNSYGRDIGKLNVHNFPNKWGEIQMSVGLGTQVMAGWQRVKQLHFEKHGPAVGASFHPVYGWQAPPNMVKLSLLVLLDGEATDMDEWELEVLGETWAYVTILLIGRDGCPNHHRHANELERVARANPHIHFFDCQGRMAERLILHDVLQALYPAQPPSDEEILDPQFDHAPPPYKHHQWAQNMGAKFGNAMMFGAGATFGGDMVNDALKHI
ncbi:MAG: hypothetical protein TREMPRED_003380 [Tremellales sp. Tagirdzhanova-0007]|nr:MAG: hypothetical protein TREMPRED_003380 [Tremellales sp. Tagirdzhanova-0007]